MPEVKTAREPTFDQYYGPYELLLEGGGHVFLHGKRDSDIEGFGEFRNIAINYAR